MMEEIASMKTALQVSFKLRLFVIQLLYTQYYKIIIIPLEIYGWEKWSTSLKGVDYNNNIILQ